MMEQTRLTGLIEGYNRILADFDACGAGEEAEELNAELEDVIFLLENIDPDDEDSGGELSDALEEMDDLAAAYDRLGQDVREVNERLKALTALARTQV